MMRHWAGLLAGVLLVLGSARGQDAAEARVQALRDSLELGLNQLELLWQRTERENTDSLKFQVQRGPGAAWKEWAFNKAPRRGMGGEDILRLADLHAALNRFDMDGCYNEQLECIRRALVMPGTERRALRRLHAEYHAAGFAPGLVQTGLAIMEQDAKEAVASGVARNLAQGYLILGDRKEAARWIKAHLRAHPDDERGKDLKARIRKMKKLDS